MKKNITYLDYAATTPVDKEVLLAMLPYLKQDYGNPSSLHSFGQSAMAAIDRARMKIAEFLECSSEEIFFTSGATEANNLAIRGIAASRTGKIHIITSRIEHESVLQTCKHLEQEGKADVTYLDVDADGRVEIEELKKSIRDNTALVSLQYVNSEIGTIQQIKDAGYLLRKRGIPFHTDAVQAALYLDCRVSDIPVDMLTLSSHKIYGPKGVGVLYKKKEISVSPFLFGGGQETGIRSGTENVPAIVGMGKATEILSRPQVKLVNIKIRHMRDRFVRGMLRKIRGCSLTGSLEGRVPSNAHFTFEEIEGRDAVMLLDQKGIASSTGSACSERSQEPSHVLLALGFPPLKALSSVRFSLGKYTKEEDMMKVLKVLPLTLDQLRRHAVH